VEQKHNKLEDDLQSYRTKVSDIVESSIEHFKDETVASAQASAESSRGNSPNRKRFLNMKHLMPDTLSSEYTILEYCKFKRDFTAWLDASYPDGYLRSKMWNAFMSRADAGWQQRADTTPGMESSDNPTTLWFHCDAIMLILHPFHKRRMQFLGTKPEVICLSPKTEG
jgi:hypothetical protein